MGIERFHESDEDPGKEAGADLPKDAGSPGGTGHSGENARPGEVARPEEPAPDNSPRESPGRADAADKPAETRTRSEYADHVAPPGSPPIEDDSPKREIGDTSSRANERHEAMQSGQRDTEESDSAREPDEQGAEQPWDEEKPESNDSTADGGAQRSPDDPAIETAHADSESTSLNSESQKAPDQAETDSGLNADERDDVLERDPHDARQPAADDPDSPLADAPSSQGADGGTDTEPGTTPPPEPGEERAAEAPSATEDPDQDTSEIDEHTRPLTDQEWAEHLDEVRDGLDKAREAGLRTIKLHTIDGKGQIYTEERSRLHDSLIEDMYTKAANVPCDFEAIVAGGLGGAGKTTVLREHAGIDTTKYLMINPDNFKEEMARRGMLPEVEGLSPMEASDLAHEESSYLAKRLARRAQAEGKNLIWDITMATKDSTEDRIGKLNEAGYARIDGIFVDIPIETSVKRTESRHREGHDDYRSGVGFGGRFVPPEVIRSQIDEQWSSQNRRTYEAVKRYFSSWSLYDNSVDDRPAILIDSNERHES